MKVFPRSDGTVEFSWNPPFAKGAEDLLYVITYGDQRKRQIEEEFEIHPSSEDKTYNVEVRKACTHL